MKMVVSAADVGMTESITDGCLRAIRDGILVDVGIMTNNFKYAGRAINEIRKYPHVGIGMDFNLVSGVPASDPKSIPSLVDDNGWFISSSKRRKEGLNEVDYDEAFQEYETQMLNFIRLCGRKPDYILGHSWSSPNAARAGYAVASKYGVPANLDENGFESKTGIKRTVSSWYEVFDEVSGNCLDFRRADVQIRTDLVNYILEDRGELLKNDYSLLRNHCGYCDAELVEMSTFNVVRMRDLEALCSPLVKNWVVDNDVEIITMKQFFEEIEYSVD